MLDATLHCRDARVSADRAAEASPRRFWRCNGVRLEDALAAPLSKAHDVEVHVSEGRWVVACPDCGGAQLAARDDRRFMCDECANVTAGGRWRRVVWPVEVAAIEGALSKRPLSLNRNWLPGESVDQLLAENEQQGPVLASFDRGLVGKASAWEGHTHTWPDVAVDGCLSCVECGLTLAESTVRESEETARGMD